MEVPDETLVALLVRLGPGWADVVAALQRLAAQHSPLLVWERICRLIIRAETVRVVPGAPRGEAVPIAQEYRERLEMASEWVLEHGLKMVVAEADALVVAVYHLRTRLGLGRAEPTGSARIGLPRRFQQPRDATPTPMRTEGDLVATLRALQGPNGAPPGESQP